MYSPYLFNLCKDDKRIPIKSLAKIFTPVISLENYNKL